MRTKGLGDGNEENNTGETEDNGNEDGQDKICNILYNTDPLGKPVSYHVANNMHSMLWEIISNLQQNDKLTLKSYVGEETVSFTLK